MRFFRNCISRILRFFLIYKYQIMGIEFVSKANVFISTSSWLDVRRGRVVIEEGVTITRSVIVLSHDATAIRVEPGSSGEYITVLKKNCFIGMNSIVMPGVMVGENSIVGAGSVVVHNVEPNTMVVGNPAKVIKRYNEQSKCWENVD